MIEEDAIEVNNVTKLFRIYHERQQSLKGALLKGGRAKYEEFAAVKDVSFSIPKGSTFGLVGSNGSGKSTLLKCIAGILEPDAGAIVTRGRMAAMLEVGSGFHSELSGRDNIYLNGAILGMSRKEIDERIDRIIEFSGVGRFIDTPVKNYSSGMYVRLGFSVAIHTEPDILIADEVFSVGDKEFQAKSRAKFEELRAGGTTIVLVTHSNALVRSFCDQAAWLEKGDLQAVGDVEEVLEQFQGPLRPKPVVVAGGGLRVGTGEALIDEISVVGEDGAVLDSIDADQPVTLRMRVTAQKVIENPVYTISVTVPKGHAVFRVNTEDLQSNLGRQEPGTRLVEVRLPQLPLGGREYSLNGDVREQGADTPLDNLQDAKRFTVAAGLFNSNRTLLQVPFELSASTG